MRNSYCINLHELKNFWADAYIGADPRWIHWLNHNVLNTIERDCDLDYGKIQGSKSIGTALSSNTGVIFQRFGLTMSIGLLPRDAIGANVLDRVSVLDPYALSETDHRHYSLGGVLLRIGDIGADHKNKMDHLRDALIAMHGDMKSWSRISFDDAQHVGAKWVTQLNKTKLETGGETLEVWSHTLNYAQPVHSFADSDYNTPLKVEKIRYQVVKLLDEWAFKSEGQVMRHCVASYWNRTGQEVFSLRNTYTGERYVTFEVRGTTVIQEQAEGNTVPDPKHIKVLDEFYATKGFSRTSYNTSRIIGMVNPTFDYSSGGGGGGSLTAGISIGNSSGGGSGGGPFTMVDNRVSLDIGTPYGIRLPVDFRFQQIHSLTTDLTHDSGEHIAVTVTGIMSRDDINRLR